MFVDFTWSTCGRRVAAEDMLAYRHVGTLLVERRQGSAWMRERTTPRRKGINYGMPCVVGFCVYDTSER